MKANNNGLVEVKCETRKVGGNWVTIIAGDMKVYILCFEEPSEEYGIDGGRISKLTIRDKNNRWLCNYDRGWDKKPTTKKAKEVLDTIVTLYN